MKAIVKIPYFDNSGIHKAGDEVEVKKGLEAFLEVVPEEKTEKAEPKEDKPKKKKG